MMNGRRSKGPENFPGHWLSHCLFGHQIHAELQSLFCEIFRQGRKGIGGTDRPYGRSLKSIGT